ncbi:hypothetical protein KEM09_02295 [Carboxylicivirga mesophila]|uniref:Uncharacterized protein n=1 Tax=Carboxylicivirga mesophila TaxID=1166478 RepID=A0ABS5K6S2_9BACT|nr:hypothetical protein [Carboxylicivirga mesophila]MBS2210211.1 hypothetical protein [Carboxylicivirga mesophila]
MKLVEKRSIYIISKPIQYVNATNIPDNSEKDCIILDEFYNADKFCFNIKTISSKWNNVQIIKTRYKALFYILKNKNKYNKLFIDSDYGVILTLFLLFLPQIGLYTYEEGYGSYRIVVENNSFVKKLHTVIYNIIGGKSWIGGNRFTKGMYLYYPEVFKTLVTNNPKKELFKLENDFYVHIRSLSEVKEFYKDIDFNFYCNKKIIIYLTTWIIRDDVKFYLDNYPDHYSILKPHPHIKEQPEIKKLFNEVVDSSIPAEIFLSEISDKCSELIIIHENSTSLIYLKPHKFKEYNYTNKDTFDYNNIRSLIQNR